ncbi:MAG: NADH-ubiquinone oxidoreductase chain [Verrucomicrobiaceae bacterium]|nr:NADH-ubiquinone oxidoreductase chain [Verrucomicrobiaceae bacterium]
MNLTADSFIALLPILITSATAVLVMLSISVRRHHWWNATLTVVGLNLALLSIIYASRVIPQAVTPLLMVDGYALLYMAIILVATLGCATLSHAYLKEYGGNREEMYLLLVLAATGGLVLTCSRHMASLFIGLELLSVPVYAMVAYMFREKRSLEGGIKYMILSAVASAFLLFGMALLYAQFGQLGFAEIGVEIAGEHAHGPLVFAGVALMLAGLGFKLSLAPFHLWTPDVYQGAPAPVGAFLATASKVAVFAVLLRFIAEAPAAHMGILRDVLLAIAIASILIGNLLALTQTNLKRLLGYSSIAHFGYVLVAIVAGNNITFEAVAVYLVTYVVTTLGAFGVVALMSSPYRGQDADAVSHYRGMFWRRPYLTGVFIAMLLSLAGIPATAGFIGKFYVITAGVESGEWWALAAVVVGSSIGLYYYLRVLVTSCLPTPGMQKFDAELDWGQQTGGLMVLAMTFLVFLIGLYPQPILELIQAATIAL